MYITVFKNNGYDYLCLAKAKRVQNNEGKKVARKDIIYNIGPLSRFDDGKPDYIKRLRVSFKAGKPLIKELEEYCTNKEPLRKYNFNFSEGETACIGDPKIFSHKLIERILEELGIMSFFASYKGFTKIQYNIYSFVKLMVFGRLLKPASKLSTLKQNDDYYDSVLDTGHNPDNIYDTLRFVAENHGKIIRRMNTNLVKKSNRNTDLIFYDVTNFYYEIENPDDDILGDNGEIIEKGLRKMGVCKEE